MGNTGMDVTINAPDWPTLIRIAVNDLEVAAAERASAEASHLSAGIVYDKALAGYQKLINDFHAHVGIEVKL